jgi:hypothetical protein
MLTTENYNDNLSALGKPSGANTEPIVVGGSRDGRWRHVRILKD